MAPPQGTREAVIYTPSPRDSSPAKDVNGTLRDCSDHLPLPCRLSGFTMLELFTRTRWDQAQDFLLSGDPPMYARLIALNAFFVVLFLIRRFKGAKPRPRFGLLCGSRPACWSPICC